LTRYAPAWWRRAPGVASRPMLGTALCTLPSAHHSHHCYRYRTARTTPPPPQIAGNMFSGKSSDLIRQIKRYQISKRKCLLLKYDRDTRYSVVSLRAAYTRTCMRRPPRGCAPPIHPPHPPLLAPAQYASACARGRGGDGWPASWLGCGQGCLVFVAHPALGLTCLTDMR
jgi:hypothetical protein